MTTPFLKNYKPCDPDNTELYRRTQSLFKKREKAKKAKEKKLKAGPPPPLAPLQLPKHPEVRPFDFGVPVARSYYRPPAWLERLASDTVKSKPSSPPPSRFSSSEISRKLKAANEIKVFSSTKFQFSASDPPPEDSNLFQAPQPAPVLESVDPDSPPLVTEFESRPAKLKFVDCDKCGKKNLSSLKQLKVH